MSSGDSLISARQALYTLAQGTGKSRIHSLAPKCFYLVGISMLAHYTSSLDYIHSHSEQWPQQMGQQ